MKKIIIFIFVSLFVISCSDSKHHDHDVSNLPSDTKFEILGEYAFTINNNKEGTISFDLPSNIYAFQLITTINGVPISVQKIKDPNNQIIFDASGYYSPYLTDGQEYQNNMNIFNFPVDSKTKILEKGRYTAYFKINSKNGGQSGSSILLVKEDSSPDYGTIQLNVVFAGSVANDSDVKTNIKKSNRNLFNKNIG